MPQVARKDRLNVKQAAEYLGIDPRTLRRYRQQGRIRTRRTPGVCLGFRARIWTRLMTIMTVPLRGQHEA